jgi:hypothetical protein
MYTIRVTTYNSEVFTSRSHSVAHFVFSLFVCIPAYIAADADMSTAVDAVVDGALYNAGQVGAMLPCAVELCFAAVLSALNVESHVSHALHT